MRDYERQVFELKNKIVETMARKELSEVVIASTMYKGAHCKLVLQIDGLWRVVSPMGSYLLDKNPTVQELLEKFVKLADQNFASIVGDIDLYDDTDFYLRKTEEYVTQHLAVLIPKFIEALEDALVKVL